MPDLLASLYKCDLDSLRNSASLWGMELTCEERWEAARELSGTILRPDMLKEEIEALPAEAKQALEALLEAGGRLPRAVFTRRFGEVREAGAGRRRREKDLMEPATASEALTQRALASFAFFDTPGGLQEFAYIPDDLAEVMDDLGMRKTEGLRAEAGARPARPGEKGGGKGEVMGRPAVPKERAFPQPATDNLLEEATTLLAAQRMGIDPGPMGMAARVVESLLRPAGILLEGERGAERAKDFLEMPRSLALDELHAAWARSETINELRMLPGLACEGEWMNPALETRRFVLSLVTVLPAGKWWSLGGFLHDIKEKKADFQRPAGDYDSWFIKRLTDGTYLRGFSSWEEVEGALLRYFITGPLFWLGRVDLASAQEGGPVTAFLVRERAAARAERGRLAVGSNGRISAPAGVPRAVRYQVARFCEWEEPRKDEYRYRVTPSSLRRAATQGLKAGQLLSLLAKNAKAEIPPAFVKSLRRWEARGSEARLETRTILRLGTPEVLDELRKSRANRFLAENLGPTVVAVRPGAGAKVLEALAEMGLLAEEVHEAE